jgi:hypothetical protein
MLWWARRLHLLWTLLNMSCALTSSCWLLCNYIYKINIFIHIYSFNLYIWLTNNAHVLGTDSNRDNQYEIVTDLPSYWGIPPRKKITLQFNNLDHPLGLGAGKFRRSCGKLIRTGSFIHMQDEWGNVDPIRRQCLWEVLMVCRIRNTLLIYIYLFVCLFVCFFLFCFLYFF